MMASASPFTGVQGWLTDEEEQMISRYASRVPGDGVIVNIGVEYGRSMAAIITNAFKSVSVIGVEIAPKDEFDENMRRTGLSGRYKLVTGDSKEVGRKWTTPIDMIFIDGAHEYENVKGDIEQWARHVKPGGFILFHDVACMSNKMPHPLHHEVSRAINEWFAGKEHMWRIVNMADSVMVFKRVG